MILPALLLLSASACWGDAAWIHAKATLAQLLIQKAWADSVGPHWHGVKPWAWSDTLPVARIRSSRLDHDLYVLDGADGSALAFGPGHVDGTAFPGDPGTSVIAGHRDTHFSFLESLRSGDLLAVQNRRGQWIDYVVTRTVVADTTGIDRWPIDDSRNEIHLITCYPFDAIAPGGPLRYIVIARRSLAAPENRVALNGQSPFSREAIP
jgi:sortase A